MTVRPWGFAIVQERDTLMNGQFTFLSSPERLWGNRPGPADCPEHGLADDQSKRLAMANMGSDRKARNVLQHCMGVRVSREGEGQTNET